MGPAVPGEAEEVADSTRYAFEQDEHEETRDVKAAETGKEEKDKPKADVKAPETAKGNDW